MNEAALYYTFSTIAQALAAAFAVLAAFVLFRLTNAERAFAQLDLRFSAVLERHSREDLWRLVTEEGRAGLEKVLSPANMATTDSVG